MIFKNNFMRIFFKYLEKYGYLLNEAYVNENINNDEDEWHTCCITTLKVIQQLLSCEFPHNEDHLAKVKLTSTLKIYITTRDDRRKKISLSMNKNNQKSDMKTIADLFLSYPFAEINFSFDFHLAAIIYHDEKFFWINSYEGKTRVVIYEFNPEVLLNKLHDMIVNKDVSIYNELTKAGHERIKNEIYINMHLSKYKSPSIEKIKELLYRRTENNFRMKVNESFLWLYKETSGVKSHIKQIDF